MNPLDQKNPMFPDYSKTTPPGTLGGFTPHSESKKHISGVRTFSSDLADAVREKGGSMIRIAVAEEEKHQKMHDATSATSKKNIVFTILGFLFVAAAIGVFVWTYQQKQKEVTPAPVVTAQPTSLIKAEDAQRIDIEGMEVEDIVTTVQTILANPGVQPGSVKNIVITRTTGGTTTRIPANEFLSTLQTHAPSNLVRALSPEYMLGVYLYDHDNLFLILHGSAHDFLLSGMLSWEPYLFNDMVPLFKIDTTGFTKAQLQDVKFTDAVIQNRDTRAVFDANKKPLLYYAFVDQNTIVIATDPKTLTEVVHRF